MKKTELALISGLIWVRVPPGADIQTVLHRLKPAVYHSWRDNGSQLQAAGGLRYIGVSAEAVRVARRRRVSSWDWYKQ